MLCGEVLCTHSPEDSRQGRGTGAMSPCKSIFVTERVFVITGQTFLRILICSLYTFFLSSLASSRDGELKYYLY